MNTNIIHAFYVSINLFLSLLLYLLFYQFAELHLPLSLFLLPPCPICGSSLAKSLAGGSFMMAAITPSWAEKREENNSLSEHRMNFPKVESVDCIPVVSIESRCIHSWHCCDFKIRRWN